jgi:hypothetical protein
MTSILATRVAPAVPVQIKAAARVSVDRDSAPAFLLEPLPDHSGSSGETLTGGGEAGGASLPASTQPLAPETMALMLEVQERAADRGRFRARWEAGTDDRLPAAESEAPATLAAAVRLYGRRRAA